jgi:hypothetical protein
MKNIIIDPDGINNFHNCAPITVRVNGETMKYPGDFGADVVYYISKRQARRIEKHFCGITDCQCPAGGVVVQINAEGTEWGLRVMEGD